MTMVIAPSRRKRKVESAPGSSEASIPASDEEQPVSVIEDVIDAPIIEEPVTEESVIEESATEDTTSDEPGEE